MLLYLETVKSLRYKLQCRCCVFLWMRCEIGSSIARSFIHNNVHYSPDGHYSAWVIHGGASPLWHCKSQPPSGLHLGGHRLRNHRLLLRYLLYHRLSAEQETSAAPLSGCQHTDDGTVSLWYSCWAKHSTSSDDTKLLWSNCPNPNPITNPIANPQL